MVTESAVWGAHIYKWQLDHHNKKAVPDPEYLKALLNNEIKTVLKLTPEECKTACDGIDAFCKLEPKERKPALRLASADLLAARMDKESLRFLGHGSEIFTDNYRQSYLIDKDGRAALKVDCDYSSFKIAEGYKFGSIDNSIEGYLGDRTKKQPARYTFGDTGTASAAVTTYGILDDKNISQGKSIQENVTCASKPTRDRSEEQTPSSETFAEKRIQFLAKKQEPDRSGHITKQEQHPARLRKQKLHEKDFTTETSGKTKKIRPSTENLLTADESLKKKKVRSSTKNLLTADEFFQQSNNPLAHALYAEIVSWNSDHSSERDPFKLSASFVLYGCIAKVIFPAIDQASKDQDREADKEIIERLNILRGKDDQQKAKKLNMKLQDVTQAQQELASMQADNQNTSASKALRHCLEKNRYSFKKAKTFVEAISKTSQTSRGVS
jgi:hypothetical protein